jgi:hypothetical protein
MADHLDIPPILHDLDEYLLPYIKNQRANFWINAALWIAVAMIGWGGVIFLITEVVKGLGKLTGQ